MISLSNSIGDQKHLIALAQDALGAGEVVAFVGAEFQDALLKVSRRGPVLPVDGLLIRGWGRDNRQTSNGLMTGLRVYQAGQVRYCWVDVGAVSALRPLSNFFVVAQADYAKLYRIALTAKRLETPPAAPPVADEETLAALRRNTVDYLIPSNLERVRRYGGRPKRGLLLSGPPGNGKTSACRWLRSLCERRGLEAKTVTPDDYRQARGDPEPAEAVRELFGVERAGVVFFDDFDAALANRGGREHAEDQAIFLGALDGMEVGSGVAHVFTSNLPFAKLDEAIRRPGRIDVVLQFPKPDAPLRRQLVDRWHPELLAALDRDDVVAQTDGMSFAELDELKNLLVLRFTEHNTWDWAWAREQYRLHRDEVANPASKVGFAAGRKKRGAADEE